MRPLLWPLVLLLLFAVGLRAEDVSQARVQQLQQQAQRVAADLNRQRDTRSQNERALADADRAIASNQRRIEQLSQEQVTLTRQIAQLQQQQQELLQALAEREQDMEALLVGLFMQAQQPALKMLLSQDGPELLSRSMVYFDYFNEQQQQLLQDYQTRLASLADNERRSQDAQQRLVRQRQELDNNSQRLSQQQQDRRQLQRQLEQDIGVKERRLSELQQDSNRLQRLLQDMQRVAQEAAAATRTQRQGLPATDAALPWPTQGRVLQAFGRPVEGNAQLRADGVLIAAPMGQEVKVVQAGQVIFADYLRGYGMLVIVDHGQGWLSLYGRNDALLVDTGQQLSAGATLARVGRSGGFSEPALYFEVRRDGRPVDPVAMLARR